jgi:TPR repeat protein
MMALALQSLAQLYALPQYMQERKAESCINEAVQIFRSLVRDNPNTFTHLLIQTILAKIDIEIQFERLPEACKYTVEAENLCRKDYAHTLDFKGLLAETLAKKALCMYLIDDYDEIEAVVDEAIVLYNQMAVESSELWYNNKKMNLLPVITMIGEYYEEGSEEVEQDINTAIKWYRKAAMEGDEEAAQKLEALSAPIIETVQPLAKGTIPTAMSPDPVISVPDVSNTPHELFEAGKRYYYGIGVQKDYATAAQLFLQAVQQEYLPALVYLGYCFFYGRGVEENKQNAIELYQAAANAGDARAQYTLGWCYYTGNGVNQDYREAVRWFNEACINGYVEAQLYMGICYEHGTGVNKNPSEAARWYRKAADNGLCEAQMRLGRIYYHGLGVMRNYAEAVRYFNQAVAQGHIEANVYLGCCYDLGRGVGENKTMAVNLYRRAAEQGSTEGQYSLGKCYYHGNGVVLDYAEAIKWLVKAAEAGHADAQKYVGRSYELGRGVDVNIATAIAWYRKAAAQGHVDAKERLKHLS